jgi:hypothetical protein
MLLWSLPGASKLIELIEIDAYSDVTKAKRNASKETVIFSNVNLLWIDLRASEEKLCYSYLFSRFNRVPPHCNQSNIFSIT